MCELLHPILSGVSKWVEGHHETVDILKWIAALIIAWATGLFRALRRWFARPKVIIVPSASMCYLQFFEELDGRQEVVRLAFFINAKVTNPTKEKLYVEDFRLTY